MTHSSQQSLFYPSTPSHLPRTPWLKSYSPSRSGFRRLFGISVPLQSPALPRPLFSLALNLNPSLPPCPDLFCLLPFAVRFSPNKQFGDLHGIGRGAFSQVIAHAPKGQPVGARQVFANAADEYLVAVVAIERHRILLGRQVVDHHH